MQIISWKVITWKGIWNKIWFPTINIDPWDIKIKPWVYKVNVIIDSKQYEWAWCLLKEKWMLEANIFDFNKNIYWKKVEIILLKFIRTNIKFNNVKKLLIQIRKDIKLIKKLKIKVITFWTFDKLHTGHLYYLSHAKKYWNKLYTIVAKDKTVAKIKWSNPKNNEKIRIQKLKDTWISNYVRSWNVKNYLTCIKDIKPDVICLWYDQKSDRFFRLREFLKQNMLNPLMVKIESFKPEIYKSSKF